MAEGWAMARSLAADLARIDGIQVDAVRAACHRHLPFPEGVTVHDVANERDDWNTLRRLGATADWSIVIAPEFDGCLVDRCRAVEQAGGRLLGPRSELVALLSDKHETAQYLESRGVAAPYGVALLPGDVLPRDFDYPAVLKPRDGAGSAGMRRVEASTGESGTAMTAPGRSGWRLERFCPGTAASVACLAGPAHVAPLAPCRQILSDDGRFAYLGGSLPLPAGLARRASRLAHRVVLALENPLGYLGIDLVLGTDPAGSEDFVVEVNPRLTTSYVGLRELCDGNLAATLLAIARGDQVELRWRGGSVQFDADGGARWRAG